MDEYFAGVGLMSMIKEYEHKRDEICKSLMNLLKEEEDKTCVWDYVFEEKPALQIWEDLLRDQKITVGRLERKKSL